MTRLRVVREGIAGNPELRLRLRAHLRELIDRIDVYPVGYQEEYDPDGELEDVEDLAETIEAGMAEFNPGWKPDKELRRFLRYVTERRMTKEGRFLRMRFKTGAKVDVVPTGSIASGYQLVQDSRRKAGWRFVSPDVDRLWREFAG